MQPTNAERTGQAAHTPTPWHIEDQTNSAGQLLYFSVEHPGRPYRGAVCNVFPAEHIGGITESEARANAAFIVRACNSHAGLVAALEECVYLMAENNPVTAESRAIDQARAALAAAKEGVAVSTPTEAALAEALEGLLLNIPPHYRDAQAARFLGCSLQQLAAARAALAEARKPEAPVS